MEGIDYAWARPTITQIKATGKHFVCRYLANLPNGKVIQIGELKALHAAGIGVVFNWEQGSRDMLGGVHVGQAHAKEAARQLTLLGVPRTVPVYFSADFDVVCW